MAGRHKAQRESTTIVRTMEIRADKDEKVEDKVKRTSIKQIVREGVRFPILARKMRAARKTFRSVFKASRPNLFA
jgi:hypothetical protein